MSFDEMKLNATDATIVMMSSYLQLGRAAFGMPSLEHHNNNNDDEQSVKHFVNLIHDEICDKQSTTCQHTLDVTKKFMQAMTSAQEAATLTLNNHCNVARVLQSIATKWDDNLYKSRVEYVAFDNDFNAYAPGMTTQIIRMFYPQTLSRTALRLGPSDIVYALSWAELVNNFHSHHHRSSIIGFTTTKIIKFDVIANFVRSIYENPKIKILAPKKPSLTSSLIRLREERSWLKDTIIYVSVNNDEDGRASKAVLFMLRVSDPVDNNVAFKPKRHDQTFLAKYYRLCMFVFYDDNGDNNNNNVASRSAAIILQAIDESPVGRIAVGGVKSVPGFLNYHLSQYNWHRHDETTLKLNVSPHTDQFVNTVALFDCIHRHRYSSLPLSAKKPIWSFVDTDGTLAACLSSGVKYGAEIYRPIMSELQNSEKFLPYFVSEHDIVSLFTIVSPMLNQRASELKMIVTMRTNNGMLVTSDLVTTSKEDKLTRLTFPSTLVCIDVDVCNTDDRFHIFQHVLGSNVIEFVDADTSNVFTFISRQTICCAFKVGPAELMARAFADGRHIQKLDGSDKYVVCCSVEPNKIETRLKSVASVELLEQMFESKTSIVKLGARQLTANQMAVFEAQLDVYPRIDGYVCTGNWNNAKLVSFLARAMVVFPENIVQTLAKLIAIDQIQI
ncbi:Hypothetical predicted protein [Olea europaea subsp. europaea]|uniref:Uncharacterized protein n=1 Tax=Olea europaea subsp. europaea TaxID=158383 RepID=A0A8S0SFG2_OLEEU|nr:Hypothetical predicted protein [Olea europaea subsp. europaea]